MTIENILNTLLLNVDVFYLIDWKKVWDWWEFDTERRCVSDHKRWADAWW